MKTTERIFLISALTIFLLDFTLGNKAEGALFRGDQAEITAKFYSGTLTAVSTNNELLGRWESLMMRAHSLSSQAVHVSETLIDSEGFGLSRNIRNLQIVTTMDSLGQKVIYSSYFPNGGGKVTAVEMELAEGLFSEYRIFDPWGTMINVFFKSDSEISRSVYNAKLAKMKFRTKSSLQSACLPYAP